MDACNLQTSKKTLQRTNFWRGGFVIPITTMKLLNSRGIHILAFQDVLRHSSKFSFCTYKFCLSQFVGYFRDIKPENLLLSQDGIVKIADFGLSKPGDVGTYLTTVTVTLWYRPPEIILGCNYNFSADIWSLGMVMCQIFKRVPLIQCTSEIEVLTKTFSYLGLPDPRLWPRNCSISREQFVPIAGKKLRREMRIMCTHAYALLSAMLEYDFEKRVKAADALFMDYFTQVCQCGFQTKYPQPLSANDPK